MNDSPITLFTRNRFRYGITFFGVLFATLLVPLGARAQLTTLNKADDSTPLDQASSWFQNATPTAGNVAVWNGTVESFNQNVTVGNGLFLGAIQILSPQGAIFINANLSNPTAALNLGNASAVNGGGIDMSNASVNFSISAPIVLASAQQWTTGPSGSLSVSGNISDNSNGFAITIASSAAGAGTVTLNGTNTFTGGVILNGGTLNVNNSQALGSGGTFVINAGTVNNNNAGVETFSNGLQIGTLGNATSGNFTFDSGGSPGSMVFNSGVVLDANATITTTGANTTFAGSGNLTFNGVTGPGNITYKGVNFGNPPSASNRLIFLGTNNFGGGANSTTPVLNITSGVVRLGNDGSIIGAPTGVGTIAGNINDGGTLELAQPSNYTLTNKITGSGAVTLVSATTLTMPTIQSYTGNTNVTPNSTVQFGNFTSTGGVAGNIANNGSVVFKQAGDTTVANTISGNGSLTQAGGQGFLSNATLTTALASGTNNNLTFTANSTSAVQGNVGNAINITYAYTGANNASGGSLPGLIVSGNNITVVLATDNSGVSANATTAFGANANLVYTAAAAGTSGNNINIKYVVAAGANAASSLALSGTNLTVTLGTGATAGVSTATALQIANLIENNVTVNSLVGAQLAPSNNGSGVLAATSSNIVLAGGANSTITTTANDIASVIGNVSITNGTAAGALVTTTVIGTGTGAVTALATGNLTGGGNASNNLTLSGNNTFNGATTISAGTITLANSTALQNSTLNYNTGGGVISFGTLAAATLGGLNGSKNIALSNITGAAVTLTDGQNNSNTTYSGVLTGPGNLTKVGGGVLTLTQNSTYGFVNGAVVAGGGVTNLNGGLVNIGNLAALGGNTAATSLTINGGGLQYATNYGLTSGDNGDFTSKLGVSTGQVNVGNMTIDTKGNNITLAANGYNGTPARANTTLTYTKAGAGNLILANQVTFTANGSGSSMTMNVSNGGLQLGNYSNTGGLPAAGTTISYNINNLANITMAEPASTTISGLISGNGTIFQTATTGVTASYTTSIPGANNDIVFTSTSGIGTVGNSANVSYFTGFTNISTANNQALGFTVTGNGVVVNLATDNSGTGAALATGSGTSGINFSANTATKFGAAGNGVSVAYVLNPLANVASTTATVNTTSNVITVNLQTTGLANATITSGSGASLVTYNANTTTDPGALGNGIVVKYVNPETVSAPLVLALSGNVLTVTLATSATAAAKANVTVGTNGTNGVTFTAVNNGSALNGDTVTYVKGAANSPLSVGVVGNAITVNLATDGSDVITTTPAQVASAIAATPAAASLFTATANGTAAITATGANTLANGTDTTIATTPTSLVSAINGNVTLTALLAVTGSGAGLLAPGSVTLTGGANATISPSATAAAVLAALNANLSVAPLVTVGLAGDGSGVVGALPQTSLTGGNNPNVTTTAAGLVTAVNNTGTVNGTLSAALAPNNDVGEGILAGFSAANLTGGTLAVANTLTLSNSANTYTGNVSILGGTLAVTGTNTLQNATLVYNAGSFTYGNLTSVNLGGLTGNQNISLTNPVTGKPVTLGIIGPQSPGIYSGVLFGIGSLVKNNTGLLVLTGSNTYSGGTTVFGGEINFSSPSNFGVGNVILSNGGIQYATGTNSDMSARLTGPFGGFIGNITANSGNDIIDTNGNNVTFNTSISGNGSLYKSGLGTLTLATTNKFTGGVVLAGGLLNFQFARLLRQR